jgi:hypothetical protein
MKSVFHFSLQLLFETFLTLINVWRVMLKMHIEMHVNCLLLLSN